MIESCLINRLLPAFWIPGILTIAPFRVSLVLKIRHESVQGEKCSGEIICFSEHLWGTNVRPGSDGIVM
jgi:hypothetical protein